VLAWLQAPPVARRMRGWSLKGEKDEDSAAARCRACPDCVCGRQAIEEYWSGALQSGGVREVSVETMDALSSGSLGYETGSLILTANGPNGEAVIDKGRYVERLRREPDGKGYSTHGIWNASPE